MATKKGSAKMPQHKKLAMGEKVSGKVAPKAKAVASASKTAPVAMKKGGCVKPKKK